MFLFPLSYDYTGTGRRTVRRGNLDGSTFLRHDIALPQTETTDGAPETVECSPGPSVVVVAASVAVAALLAEALESALRVTYPDLCASATTPESAMDDLRVKFAAVLLLDASSLAGRRLLIQLSQAEKRRVVVMSIEGDAQVFRTAARAGAIGYVSSGADTPEIADAVGAALRGRATCSDDLLGELIVAVADAGTHRETLRLPLTTRERDVAELVAAGLTNREIAHELYLQPQTVRNYVHQVMTKLGVSTRTAIVAVWLEAAALNECRVSRRSMGTRRRGVGPQALEQLG